MTLLSRMMLVPAVLALSLCAACAPGGESDGEEEDLQESAAALVAANGVQMNGVQMNGVQMNGVQMNGVQMNGVQMNGVQMNGTTLTGTLVNGLALGGFDLVGATMVATLSNGGSVPLKVDAIAPALDPDIKLYTVSYLSGGTWKALCGSTAAGPVQAIPLQGRWDGSGAHVDDPTMFTFACRGAVLAKCVELGYKPWSSVQECKNGTCNMVSLAPLHQACTRMIRADYCGDGVAHTTDGTPINLWDAVEIQQQARVSSDWKLEAEWGASGMMCAKDLRQNVDSVTSEYIDDHCPSRWSAPSFSCFGSTSTFFTKYGFSTPLASRSLLRNSFDYYHVYIWQAGADGDDD